MNAYQLFCQILNKQVYRLNCIGIQQSAKILQQQPIIIFYNSLIMEKPNLFYNWDVIQNVGEFLSLKDLLSTATLSKEYNHILKKYVKEHFALENNQKQNEFQLLKSLFNRKIFNYNKNEKFAKVNPSNFIARSLQSQDLHTIVQTLDCQFKIVKTNKLIEGNVAELISLPQHYKFVHITQGGMLYCADNSKITRYNMTTDAFAKEETLQLKGQIEDMICGGFKFAIVVIRDTPEQVKLLVFDSNQKLEEFKMIKTPFSIHHFSIEEHLVMGKNFCYFIFNEVLYQFNQKTGQVLQHSAFSNKKIVKILGGNHHFVAYEKVKELAQTWNTEDVIKFAHKEGFEDFIKIFKAEKVTGKVLLNMDKKYMEEVLGIENIKLQIKLKLRLEESNKEDPESYVVHGWGRASEGQLGTNPSKEITKPIKIKLPADCEILKLSGNFTFIHNKKTNVTSINTIEEKTNKFEWKQVTNKKIWSLSTVDENVLLVCSATKDKVPQRESEAVMSEKKEKLRTAKNIIDKITWDEHLKPEEFKVGYLDKYQGILEIPFSDLQTSDVVKEYRIEYFKKGGQVVWDKKKRIDIL